MTVEFLDYTEGSDRHYHDMLGYKMTEWREGYVRLEMDVQPRHRQRGTFTHGGILMGLLDIAGLLSNLYDKRDKVETLTLALSTNFLAAVHSKRVAAIGEATKAGNASILQPSSISPPIRYWRPPRGRSEFVRRKTPSYLARPTLSRIHSR